MSSSTASLTSAPLKKGTYAPSTASDLRSPCPLINCLANHGYIPRDGRDVRPSELSAAMNEVGLSTGVGAVFAKPIFLEQKAVRENLKKSSPNRLLSFWRRLWYLICNPWALILPQFGMRELGQKDSAGYKCLNLNQLALPGVVEHDISLTRHDEGQGDNLTPQPDLIRDLLASSSDGGKTLSAADLAALRKRRIEKQRQVNPGNTYGPMQHQIACTEIALVLDVFGDGQKVRHDFAKAFFHEERLPIQEGWKKRRWWTLGFVELGRTVGLITKLVGMEIK